MGKNKAQAPTLPRIRYMCFDLTYFFLGLGWPWVEDFVGFIIISYVFQPKHNGKSQP